MPQGLSQLDLSNTSGVSRAGVCDTTPGSAAIAGEAAPVLAATDVVAAAVATDEPATNVALIPSTSAAICNRMDKVSSAFLAAVDGSGPGKATYSPGRGAG